MHKLTKVTTGFSESNELANREWNSLVEADQEIVAVMAKTYTIADRCYSKTDVTLTWEDGREVSFELSANRYNTITSELAQRYQYYHRGCPEHITPRQYGEARKFWTELVENYEV